MRPIWYVMLGVVASFVLLCLWHLRFGSEVTPTEQVTITIDTLTYNRIEPSSVTEPTHTDSLPIYHFADSTDGRWSAEVAGRDVELRSLVLLDKSENRHTVSHSAPRWEVVAKGGVSGASSWVGLGVEHNIGRVKLSLGAGYDPLVRTPHLEGSVGISLWREY